MDSRVKMGFRDYLVDFIFIRKIMRITITAAMCEFTCIPTASSKMDL